jgi:hypothetical protein
MHCCYDTDPTYYAYIEEENDGVTHLFSTRGWGIKANIEIKRGISPRCTRKAWVEICAPSGFGQMELDS